MSARFRAVDRHVMDQKTGDQWAYATRDDWAEMIADGLNLIVDQVTPWSPSAAHVDVLDGVVIDNDSEQKAIGWHDSAATHL